MKFSLRKLLLWMLMLGALPFWYQHFLIPFFVILSGGRMPPSFTRGIFTIPLDRLKKDIGIQRDFFIDIPPDGTDDGAEAARLQIVELGRKILDQPEF